MARKRMAIVGKLRVALERRGSPRLEMAVITLLTGASGFLASFALLQVGLDLMWLRYWVALFAAYLVFFGLLRLWLRLRGRKFGVRDLPDPSDLIVDLPLPGPAGFRGGGGGFGGGGASATFTSPKPAVPSSALARGGSAPDFGDLDADETTIPLLLVVALLGALCASLWTIYVAPSMMAELLVDTALVSGLYRRLRRESPSSWMATALRRTALPFALTCILFVFLGWFVQSAIPEANSIGDALRHLETNR